MRILLLTLVTLLVSGCTITDSASIVTGEARSATNPEAIKIYRQAPAKYQEIGIIYSSAGHDFRSDSGILDSAVEALKIEAARLGANGIILSNIKQRDGAQTVIGTATTTTYNANGMSTGTGTVIGTNGGDRYTRLEGLAIFVTDK
jgi:hypothetical protein